MTSFSMANMDYTPVKFMIKCFEANYPESLGTVLVYKAPWIFQGGIHRSAHAVGLADQLLGIWKVIRGWLDPVVASKVHFLNTSKEMSEFVDLDKLPKEVDGNSDWEYRYVEPIEGENAKMSDTATRDKLLEAREQLVKEYELATLEWLNGSDAEKTAAVKERRNVIAAKLRDDYWNLDPYLRARSLFDRIGMIQPGGKIEFYPEQREEKSSAGVCDGNPPPVAPEDDVD
jgi:CRAL/TRIO-like protein